jgi:hypothetical protein
MATGAPRGCCTLFAVLSRSREELEQWVLSLPRASPCT